MAEHIARVVGVRVMNAPGDIEILFDKRLCHERCEEQGIPVPPALGTAACFDELIARMEQADEERVFIKLANGSSASGVVAFLKNRRQSLAMTSAEIVREAGSLRLYNSLKVRSYTRPRDQADLIDALCREQVHIERWLPKAVLDRYGNFDLRIVVIGRKARHWVVRQSRGPLTNLHLGNRRGNREEFLNRIGPESWNKLQQTCEQSMQAFPGSLYAGVDLLVLPDYRDHRVLELNAFGDLLPGVLSQGADTYTAEIEAAVRCVESY